MALQAIKSGAAPAQSNPGFDVAGHAPRHQFYEVSIPSAIDPSRAEDAIRIGKDEKLHKLLFEAGKDRFTYVPAREGVAIWDNKNRDENGNPTCVVQAKQGQRMDVETAKKELEKFLENEKQPRASAPDAPAFPSRETLDKVRRDGRAEAEAEHSAARRPSGGMIITGLDPAGHAPRHQFYDIKLNPERGTAQPLTIPKDSELHKALFDNRQYLDVRYFKNEKGEIGFIVRDGLHDDKVIKAGPQADSFKALLNYVNNHKYIKGLE